MRKRALTATAIALGALLTAAGFAPRSGTDEAEIRAAVQAYFDGMMNGSPETLRRAFEENALLIGPADDGGVVRIPFAQWSARMSRPLPDPGARTNRILSVDIAGNAAVAKTELVWPTVRYVDYLSLLKVKGEWKIVNKIWHEEAPPGR